MITVSHYSTRQNFDLYEIHGMVCVIVFHNTPQDKILISTRYMGWCAL
uniref:Uncharacterized protein n=1 Tax=Medicago truncatula TaxID=3880 RepID=I3SCU2_MEDTR|nr:unknown [Medicago truncatula]